jgi:hypothetical protein
MENFTFGPALIKEIQHHDDKELWPLQAGLFSIIPPRLLFSMALAWSGNGALFVAGTDFMPVDGGENP